jgi:hypothetical protein
MPLRLDGTEEMCICRNALIADWSPLLSGLTGPNANAVQMGAGDAAKAATVYTAKYCAKETVDIEKVAIILRDAQRLS